MRKETVKNKKESNHSNRLRNSTSSSMPLIAILLVAIFFRFYHYPLRYGFDYDALRDGLLTRFAATHLQFPLVGPPTSVGDFTFGPWYYYLLITGELVFRTIYSPWIVIGLLSLLEVILFYKIGEELENKVLGVIFGLLVAVSSSQIIVSTGLSNPDIVPVCTVAALYLFLKICRSKKEQANFWHVLLLGFILGVGFFSHYQMIGIFIVAPLLFYEQRKQLFRVFISFIIGILLSFLPLFIFDLSHKFITIRGMTQYFIHGTAYPIYIPNSWKIYLFEFWPKFFIYTIGLSRVVGIITMLVTSITIAFCIYTRRLQRATILMLIAFLFNILLFRYFKGERVIYYEYFLQPFVFFFVGYSFYFLMKIKKPIGISLLFCLLFFMITTSMQELSPKQSHIDSERLSAALLQIDPLHTMTVYNCKSAEKYQSYSLALIIEEHKKTGTGRKIGIATKACDVMPVIQITHGYLNGINEQLIDLSNISEDMLRTKGWIPVTPKTIYYSLLYSNNPNPFVYPELHTR